MQTNDVFSDFLSWLTSPCGHLWQAVIGVKVKTHINGTSAARLSDTVGRNPAPVEKKIIRLSHYLQGLCIPGGAGFPPSIVSLMESGTCITNTHTHTQVAISGSLWRQATSWQLHWPLTQPQACSMKLFAWVSKGFIEPETIAQEGT